MRSVEKQTIGIETLEIILVNDASTDNTLEKLKEWEKLYPENILVITYEENLRQGGARNVGMQYATSEYIGFLDADDWIEPDMYETLYEKTIHKKYDVVRGKFIRHDAEGKCDMSLLDKPSRDLEYIFEPIHGFYLGKYEDVGNVGEFGSICTGIYRRSLIIDNEVFFPEKLAYEDNYWGDILSLYIKSSYIIDKVFYHYMLNPESTVTERNGKHHFDRLKLETMKLEKYKEMGLLEIKEFYEVILRQFVYKYFFGTFFILCTRFDRVPVNIVNIMIRKVVSEFPDWKKGKFIKEVNELNLVLLKLLDIDRDLTQTEVDDISRLYLDAWKVCS